MAKQLSYDGSNYPSVFNLLATADVCDVDEVLIVVPHEDDAGGYTATLHYLGSMIGAANDEARAWDGGPFPKRGDLPERLPALWALFGLCEWSESTYIYNSDYDGLENVSELIRKAMQEVADNY